MLDFFTPMQQPEETDTGSLERVGRNTLREDIDRGYNPPLNADDRKNKDRIDHGLEESTTLRSNFGSADEFRNSKDNIDRGMPDVTSTIRPKYKEPVYGPPPYPTYPPTVSPSTPRDTEEEMTGKESKDAGGEKSVSEIRAVLTVFFKKMSSLTRIVIPSSLPVRQEEAQPSSRVMAYRLGEEASATVQTEDDDNDNSSSEARG